MTENGWRGQIEARVHTLEVAEQDHELRLRHCEAMEHCKDWRKDLESRMRRQEGFRWVILGAVLVIQALGVLVVVESLRSIIHSVLTR